MNPRIILHLNERTVMHLYLVFERHRAVDQRLRDRWANFSRFTCWSFQADFTFLSLCK